MPLALTDQQLSIVTDAAALLPPAARDAFLRSVAAVLGSDDHPSDGAVMRALSLVLSERGVAVGKQFFRDGHRRARHGEASRTLPSADDGRARSRLGRASASRGSAA